jgi:DNA-3-methyladenine glycosylase I
MGAGQVSDAGGPVSDAGAGPARGPDGLARCPWALGTADYLPYHDEDWGRPVRDDAGMFERLSLEAFQSGLSWLTILRKRENFRAAFGGFDPAVVAAFGARDTERLLADAGIVRNRAKIEAVIGNARATLAVPSGLAALMWRYGQTAARAPDTGVQGVRQGAAAARVHLHRPGHGLRCTAGMRSGERPSRRLLPPGCVFMNSTAMMCAQRFANHTCRARLKVGCLNGGNGGQVTESPQPAGGTWPGEAAWPAPGAPHPWEPAG